MTPSSNLVRGMTLRYPASDTVWGSKGHRVTKCKNILKAIEWQLLVCTSIECTSSSLLYSSEVGYVQKFGGVCTAVISGDALRLLSSTMPDVRRDAPLLGPSVAR